MDKPQTITEVANLSLTKLGERENELLTDVDTDTGESANVCRQFLPITLRDVQTNFKWDELYMSVVLPTPSDDLTEDVTTPWAYRYLLPADYLAPQWTDEDEYEVQAGHLYCNHATDFVFRYRRYSEDPTEWDSQLLQAVVYSFAIAICMPVTENDTKHAKLISEYETIVLPRLERTASIGKKYPNNRRKHGTYANTRAGNYGYGGI